MMSIVEQSLGGIERRMAEAGVRDLKFFFQPDVAAQPLSETKKSVATVVESYLAGRLTPMGRIGDAISNQA